MYPDRGGRGSKPPATGRSGLGEREIRELVEPEHSAPEHSAPEHSAPEHSAPEHSAPEHSAPEGSDLREGFDDDRELEGTRTTVELEREYIGRALHLRSLVGELSNRPEADRLAALMEEVHLPKGAYLYRKGEAPDFMFFIVSGEFVQGAKGAREFGKGDVLGLVDVMQERSHALDAQAVTDAVVLRLAADDWLEFLEDNFEIMHRAILSRTADLPPILLGSVSSNFDIENVSYDPSAPLSSRWVYKLAVLHACPAFGKAGIQAVARLARAAHEVQLLENEVQELGEGHRGLWVVLGGRVAVEVRSDEREFKYVVGPGSLVGSLSLLEDAPELLLVRAVGPGTRLLYLARERFLDVLEDHFDLVRSLLAFVASQIEHLNMFGGSMPQNSRLPAGG